jgi:VanZ family protein
MMGRFTRILPKLPAPLIIGAIWFLSSQSALPRLKGVFGFDKLQHFAAYAVLAFSAGLWISRERLLRRPWISLFTIVGLGSLYGVIDEIHQYFVPGRDCNVWDWAADTLGAALGTGAILLAVRLLGKKTAASVTTGERP